MHGGRNRIVEDFAQVSEDKLAVMYRKKVSIYDTTNSRELLSRDLYNVQSLHCIENRYALFYFTVGVYQQKEHRLMAIDLNDFSVKEMNVAEKISSSVYLESGLLVLGGLRITTLRTDRWPFEVVKSECIHRESTERLVALSGDCFASVSDHSMCIWNSDLKMLRKLETDKYICELKALGNDVLLSTVDQFGNTQKSSILLYNFKSGELLKELSIPYKMKCLFLTPDKEFLVMVGDRKIWFFHVNGAYVYSEVDVPQGYQFQSEKVKLWQNRKFARKMNRNRSVFAFDFDKC